MRGDVGMSEREPAGAGFDYDGVRFRPVDAERAPGAPSTVGLYRSRGGEVWAEFSGGSVRTGRLVGTTRPDGTIDGAYCQVYLDGSSAAGTLVSVPDRLPDGRMRLHEHWRRADGCSGVSVIEQIGEPAGGGPLSPAQLDYLRDAIYRQVHAHLGPAGIQAAARCATRLLDLSPAGPDPRELTVLVAFDGDPDAAFTLAFVRTMQLITARVHGETFTLRTVGADAATENVERVARVLGLLEDPACESPSAQGDRAGVDIVIGASTTPDGPPSFALDANAVPEPEARRSLVADLLKYENDREDR